MSPRKVIKKQLARLKHYRSALPRLIDCSEVYGDGYYTQKDLDAVNEEIQKLEKEIENLNT